MSSYQLDDQDYITVHRHEAQESWEDTKSSRTTKQSKLLAPPPSTRSGKGRTKRKESKTTTQSGSDTEKETSNMPSRISRRPSSSSSVSRKDSSKSSTKSKKTDDWTDVTEPDERRRIQNRIAQRKFREKAREQKDRAQRDAQNQQYAGSAYHIPGADDISFDDADLSGLPWGGLNMRHVVARGHAVETHRTHSHHSGYTTSDARPDSGGAYTAATGTPLMGPVDLVDQSLYGMNPYGYPATTAGDEAAAAGAYYGSPAYGYYDYDTTAAGDGAHPM